MEQVDMLLLLGGTWDGTYYTVYHDDEKELEWLYASVEECTTDRILVSESEEYERQLRLKPKGTARKRMGAWITGKLFNPPEDVRMTPFVLEGLERFSLDERGELHLPPLDNEGASIIESALTDAIGCGVTVKSPRVFGLSERAQYRLAEVVSKT
jgi:hypothetical protein